MYNILKIDMAANLPFIEPTWHSPGVTELLLYSVFFNEHNYPVTWVLFPMFHK